MLQKFYYIFGITTTCFVWLSAIVVGIVKYRKIAKRKKEQEEFDKQANEASLEEESVWKFRYFDVDFDNTAAMSNEINEPCSNGAELVQILPTPKGFKGIFRVLEEVKK